MLNFLFFIHIIFLSLFFVNPNYIVFFIVDLIAILFLFIYELLQIITNFKIYTKRIINLYEAFLLIFSVITLILNINRDEIKSTALTSVNICCLIFNYYRGLISLQVFDSFRHLINMIFGVTESIFPTLFLFLYFLIAFSIFFTLTTLEDNSFQDSLKIKSLKNFRINFWKST